MHNGVGPGVSTFLAPAGGEGHVAQGGAIAEPWAADQLLRPKPRRGDGNRATVEQTQHSFPDIPGVVLDLMCRASGGELPDSQCSDARFSLGTY